MFLGFMLFSQTYLKVVTITFSALIIVELLNMISNVTKMSVVMMFAQVVSLCSYFATIYFYHEYINVSDIDQDFIINVGIIAFVAWFPIYAMKRLVKRYSPTEEMIIMRECKIKIPLWRRILFLEN
jgi:phospholipid-translocating ATPase